MPNTIEATITQKNGVIYVERMGERLSLEIGDAIYEQDLILTGPDTVAEIQYRDGTKSRLAPDTEMRLVDYEYGLSADSENSFLVDIQEGAVRTVTGDIVDLNPNGFNITSHGTEMNVLGSEVLTVVRNGIVDHLNLFSKNGVMVTLNNVTVPLKNLQLASFDYRKGSSFEFQQFNLQEANEFIDKNAKFLNFKIPLMQQNEGDWEDVLNSENELSIVLTTHGNSFVSAFIHHNLQTEGEDFAFNSAVSKLVLSPLGGLLEFFPTLLPNLEIASKIYPKNDPILETNGASDIVNKVSFDTYSTGTLELTALRDDVTITNMIGGEINLNDNNDTITITNFTNGTINTNAGNDYVKITTFGDGTDSTSMPNLFFDQGSNVLDIDNFYSGRISVMGADALTIDIGVVGLSTGGFAPELFAGDGDTKIDMTVRSMFTGVLNLGNNDDSLKITYMEDGSVSLGAGNDFVDINTFVYGNITLGAGNNNMLLGSWGKSGSGGGTIYLNEGNNVLSVFDVDFNDVVAVTGSGIDLLIRDASDTESISSGSGSAHDFDFELLVTGATSADDLNYANFGISFGTDRLMLDSRYWTESGGRFHYSNGSITATLTDDSLTYNAEITTSVGTENPPFAASVATMSMADASMGVATLSYSPMPASDPSANQAYESTLGHYQSVI